MINKDKSLISEVNDIRTRMGLIPLNEQEITESEVIKTGSVLNENWFKDKINKLRNRFSKSQGTPYGGGSEMGGVDAGDTSDEHGEVKMGALPIDAMDHKIVGDISNNLSNAEDEYEPDLNAMDKHLSDMEAEYEPEIPKIKALPKKPSMGGKAIAKPKM